MICIFKTRIETHSEHHKTSVKYFFKRRTQMSPVEQSSDKTATELLIISNNDEDFF